MDTLMLPTSLETTIRTDTEPKRMRPWRKNGTEQELSAVTSDMRQEISAACCMDRKNIRKPTKCL